jgi:hypothetical protein
MDGHFRQDNGGCRLAHMSWYLLVWHAHVRDASQQGQTVCKGWILPATVALLLFSGVLEIQSGRDLGGLLYEHMCNRIAECFFIALRAIQVGVDAVEKNAVRVLRQDAHAVFDFKSFAHCPQLWKATLFEEPSLMKIKIWTWMRETAQASGSN